MNAAKENEKLVRAFYEATVPGHREALRGLQAPHVIYDLPKGSPSAAAISRASRTCLSDFSPASMGLLTFASSPKSSSRRASMSSRSAVSKERLGEVAYQSMCLSLTSGQSVRDISNDCALSRIQQC